MIPIHNKAIKFRVKKFLYYFFQNSRSAIFLNENDPEKKLPSPFILRNIFCHFIKLPTSRINHSQQNTNHVSTNIKNLIGFEHFRRQHQAFRIIIRLAGSQTNHTDRYHRQQERIHHLIEERHFDRQELQQQRHGNRDQHTDYSSPVRCLLPE